MDERKGTTDRVMMKGKESHRKIIFGSVIRATLKTYRSVEA
jgi:hypothetical protein